LLAGSKFRDSLPISYLALVDVERVSFVRRFVVAIVAIAPSG